MLKARANLNGRDTVIIGLTFGNLAKLRAEADATYLHIEGAEMSLPFDIIIFSGKDVKTLLELIAPGISADTKVTIDPKLRN